MDEDPRTLALAEAKKRLDLDEEAKNLFVLAQKAREIYLTRRLELGEEAEETRLALKEFHARKLALDEHPSAREYNRLSAELSWLYRTLDDILFGPFKQPLPCEGKR